MNVVRNYQAPADALSTGDVQARPPFVVEFEYLEGTYSALFHTSFSQLQTIDCLIILLTYVGADKFKFIVVPVHASADMTAREEINYASTVALHLMYLPTCFSENAIVLGTFNQVPEYVGQNWHSNMQLSSTFLELHYEGSSTVLTNDTDNRLDRYRL